MSDQPESSKAGSSKSIVDRNNEFNVRFRKLAQLRQESTKLNKADVIEEDRKRKNPKHELQEARKEWELKELEERKKAEEEGLDYDRIKALQTPADVARKIEAARKRKKNPVSTALIVGDYESMSLRQNERLTRNIKPDVTQYKKMKECLGEDQFYPSANTMIDGHYYPTAKDQDKLADAVNDMIKKRNQLHRRRMFDPDAEVTYINDKNMVFNRKLEKFYGKYTEDLREDLERGTAL